ncbi:MAG: GUN4 domain-containing protein, partial [Cyanobacteria bacterium J06633_2]
MTNSFHSKNPRLSSKQRLKVVQFLNELPSLEFEQLVFALNPPSGMISGQTSAQGHRVSELLEWVQGSTGPGLTELHDILEEIADISIFDVAEPQSDFVDSLGRVEGGNYAALENYLKNKNWADADEETRCLLLMIGNRTQEGWLRITDFPKLSCAELQTINALWESYSNRRFGFSIKKQLWKSVSSSTKLDIILNFCQACSSTQSLRNQSWMRTEKILTVEEIYERARESSNLGM